MNRSALLVLLGAALLPTESKTQEMRMVLGTDVLCRAEPDTASVALNAFQPGDAFPPADSVRTSSPNGPIDLRRGGRHKLRGARSLRWSGRSR